jgi:pimeloyl-ACP methyl ester carboxylesterase
MSEWWSIAAGCIGWPAAPKNPQHAVHIDDAPPILLVGNTGDPVTPVSGAESLSHGIEGSEVLTYDGVGHTAHMRDDCATKHIDDYLITGKLPASNTVCS